MFAHIEHEWHTRWSKVWLYDKNLSGTVIYYPDKTHEPTMDHIMEFGTLPDEPSLYLSPEMLKALGEAAVETLPPSQAVDRHLKDSIEVRDRLLTIIEGKKG